MMKPIMRQMISFYALLYRLTGGRVGGRMAGLNVLLLTTTGRKTGRQRVTPLGYFEHEGAYVITASFVAFGGKYPGWFQNLRHKPRVSIRIRDEQLEADAEVAAPDKRSLLWGRLLDIAPDYKMYADRATREIPVVMLHPVPA